MGKEEDKNTDTTDANANDVTGLCSITEGLMEIPFYKQADTTTGVLRNVEHRRLDHMIYDRKLQKFVARRTAKPLMLEVE